MGRQLVVRLLQMVVSLIGMSLLIFVVVRASGDPVDLMRTSTSTDEELANIRVQWGLDKSYAEQYWVFFSGLARRSASSRRADQAARRRYSSSSRATRSSRRRA